MKKNFVLAIVGISLVFCMSVSAVAFASEGGGKQPRWTNVSNIRLTMDYSGGAVIWTGEITGYSGVTSISATFTLEKKNASGKYESVASWKASSSKPYLYKEGSIKGAHGSYRLNVSATVKGLSGNESVSTSIVKTL